MAQRTSSNTAEWAVMYRAGEEDEPISEGEGGEGRLIPGVSVALPFKRAVVSVVGTASSSSSAMASDDTMAPIVD